MHPELVIMPEGEDLIDHADSALSFASSRPSAMGHRTQSGVTFTSRGGASDDDLPEPNLSRHTTERGHFKRHTTEPSARAARSNSVSVQLWLVRFRRDFSSADSAPLLLCRHGRGPVCVCSAHRQPPSLTRHPFPSQTEMNPEQFAEAAAAFRVQRSRRRSSMAVPGTQAFGVRGTQIELDDDLKRSASAAPVRLLPPYIVIVL